jgi:hypothetical protein
LNPNPKRRNAMATRGAGDKGPVVHPVLATLAGDVHPGDAVRLQGYVGPTRDGETLRLYAALEDLSDYIDVPRDEVLGRPRRRRRWRRKAESTCG